ncbi:MAG: 6,7-dimethyl-8-ribityllumazine synthase [Alistipes sp.]|nr:6,7-dimethyl-8-ribityllumazine synthase [Alistipes sp.]MBR5885507.1 6,7-dimethyl-8-ribityllumazine synthase [Alistipes sp.]
MSIKVGIIVVDSQAQFAHENLSPLSESLKLMGCSEQNILLRHSPSVYNVPLTVQFFAEYTDVDAVIVLAENDQTAEYNSMLYGVTRLQMLWNMPVLIGGVGVAADAVEMVRMQNEMEAAAPEYNSADRKSIN